MHKLLAVLLALLISLSFLTTAIYTSATADWVMLPLMERFAPPEDSRLPAEEYAPVTDMITSYLQGNEVSFQHIYTVDGTEYAAFNQKEQQHMADVQSLFRLCGRMMRLGILSVGLLAIAPVFHRENRRKAFVWLRRTLLFILALAAVISLVACIDFNSLFILFHKVAFTNDLWLLDPNTDLLIRLMPIEFFVSYAAIIGGLWLLGMGAMLLFASVRIRKLKATEGE